MRYSQSCCSRRTFEALELRAAPSGMFAAGLDDPWDEFPANPLALEYPGVDIDDVCAQDPTSGIVLPSGSESAAVVESKGHHASANDNAAVTTTSDVYSFEDFSITGSSTLTRNNNGVSMTLTTSGLEPGAYTVWWIVFKNPDNCAVPGPGNCGIDPADFAVGGPAGFGFLFAAGHIVGETGEATFAGHLNEGTALLNDNLELDEVFDDARTAEIHLVVRYHGPAEPGRIPEQIHTFEPDLGLEADVQFAVHPVP